MSYTYAEAMEAGETGNIVSTVETPTSTDWLSQNLNIPLMDGGTYSYDPTATKPYWSEPEPSWLTTLTKPFSNFGQNLITATEKQVAAQYERLPGLLWEWGLQEAGVIEQPKPKQVKTDEGAGVTITNQQPAHAGGEPAKPIFAIIPSMGATAPAQSKEAGTLLLIAAGLFVVFILLGK